MGQTRKRRSFLLYGSVLNSLVGGLMAVPIASSAAAGPSVFEGPVPRPTACAPGDRPETGIQGEVPNPHATTIDYVVAATGG